MGRGRRRVGIPMLAMIPLALAPVAVADSASLEEQVAPGSHFVLSSAVTSPSPAEITEHLERTWRTFRELFGVEPRPLRVVLNAAAADAAEVARADRGSAAPSSSIAWTVTEGEDLQGQGFSDLSHEIAHLYFLELMGSPQGLHQTHAWLHEAVACYHETPGFVANRRSWIRERLGERIPLPQLFEMKNPVKESPLVELTVRLHAKLARGEIDVVQMNEQISAWASAHTQHLLQAGVRNMTWYAESLSVFEFLLAREGNAFIRALVRRLRDGARMEEIVRKLPHYPDGIASLETEWVRWVEAQPVPY